MTKMKLLLAAAVFVVSGSAIASTFHGFSVVGVPEDDVLNARSGPGTAHSIQTAYPNGANLSLTGNCTGGLRIDDLGGLSRAQKHARIKSRWCEIWHDPNGSGAFVSGWVYGRYIYPH